jgi:hypothetical protein
MRSEAKTIKNMNYICLVCVIVLGLLACVGCSSNDDDPYPLAEVPDDSYSYPMSTVPDVSGSWILTGFDSSGSPLAGSEPMSITQNDSDIIVNLDGRIFEGSVTQENTIYFDDSCEDESECDAMEMDGTVSEDTMSGTWIEIKNEQPWVSGTWTAVNVGGSEDTPHGETWWYSDADGDGYGNINYQPIQSFTQPAGYVADNTDCNDNDSAIHPDADEICDDGKDNDCDRSVDCADSDCSIDDNCDGRFTDMGDGTVKDNISGLIWLKDANCSEFAGTDSSGMADWITANEVAAVSLSDGICGLTDGSSEDDWRLPTKEEWQAFYDSNYESPALTNTAGDNQWEEGDAFYGVQSDCYWSSTAFWVPTAWCASMTYGNVSSINTASDCYVWPVRSDN